MLALHTVPLLARTLTQQLAKMIEAPPLIAVVGSTGVGKSRLAVELASSIRDKMLPSDTPWTNAKIINADAMQTYKGLDLVTNKITRSEMNGIEHVLIDFRGPTDEYVVTEWVADAISEINSAHESRKLPVVVGGTSYWVQHLLFANRLASLEEGRSIAPSGVDLELEPSLKRLLDDLPTRADDVDEETSFQLHNLLTRLDPAAASRWHWKDTRKVLRSINIVLESNMTVGETYEAQPNPTPRYPALIFWLYMEPRVLNPMLDRRIDRMVELGLREEIEETRRLANSSTNKIEMIGLNQAIGYKEFEAYFNDPNRPQLEFDRGVERMKVTTRQYATRQVKWIKSQLLPLAMASRTVHVELLEIKNPDQWDNDILKVALGCLSEFLSGHLTSEKRIQSDLLQSFITPARVPETNERRKIRCDICTTDPRRPVMLDEVTEWDLHRKSRSHRRKASRESRKEEQLQRQVEIQAQRAAARADTAPSIQE
ncbi:tRNA dimethylallyltransferase [Ceratobasidium sp. AG-Ba]|nr:tRNA dimethylallyltransferase [Ceratobasidium sp. AG-Ba]